MKADNSNYREDFPHYSGHIPYKKNEVIGMTVGATNNYIKSILSKEPIKEEIIVPITYDDYSYYNKDYFNDTFSRDYKLDEDIVYSNKSKDAETWLGSSKYKIYPQHIPGYKAHVPGVISGNIIGNSYSKSTAKAIKGDFIKDYNLKKDERYKTSNKIDFNAPTLRGKHELERLKQEMEEKREQSKPVNNQDLKRIFKSKIANIPTPGYSGHTTLFQKAISYLNIDKALEIDQPKEEFDYIMDSRMSETYRLDKNKQSLNNQNLPYISGYKGFRTGVKSGNYHGGNFIDVSSTARSNYLKD